MLIEVQVSLERAYKLVRDEDGTPIRPPCIQCPCDSLNGPCHCVSSVTQHYHAVVLMRRRYLAAAAVLIENIEENILVTQFLGRIYLCVFPLNTKDGFGYLQNLALN